jgi:TP901-1 family phage major tail protein
VAGLRARSLALNATTVDITDQDSAGRWRELLEGAGLKTARISGSGIFKDAASDETLRQYFFAGTVRDWQVIVLEGPFQIASLEYGGQHDGQLHRRLRRHHEIERRAQRAPVGEGCRQAARRDRQVALIGLAHEAAGLIRLELEQGLDLLAVTVSGIGFSGLTKGSGASCVGSDDPACASGEASVAAPASAARVKSCGGRSAQAGARRWLSSSLCTKPNPVGPRVSPRGAARVNPGTLALARHGSTREHH